MSWLAVLGSISFLFIVSGCALAIKRIRIYRQETEARRTRAFAEMMKIADKQNTKRIHRRQGYGGQGTQNAGETVRRDD